MKHFSFFATLLKALFAEKPGKPLSPREQDRLKRDLMTRGDILAAAKTAGDARRINAWKRSCIGGYERKFRMGQCGGIPAWWIVQRRQPKAEA